jgi:hypothetical protein
LGTFHHALTLACTRQNYYLTFQNKLVFFSNSINRFFPFLFCFLCVCCVFATSIFTNQLQNLFYKLKLYIYVCVYIVSFVWVF